MAHGSRNAILGAITNEGYEMTLDQCDKNESIRRTMQQGSLQQPLFKKQEELTAEESWKGGKENDNLNLVPDHNTETALAERLFVPLEECRVVERLLTALYNKKV